jgi:hypothetical protein
LLYRKLFLNYPLFLDKKIRHPAVSSGQRTNIDDIDFTAGSSRQQHQLSFAALAAKDCY